MIRKTVALLLLLPALAWADYASVILADSPKYYWHLGETSGTTATNSGSTSTLGDGTYHGTVSLNQAGIPGYSATNGSVGLDGSTAYVSAADTGGSLGPPAGGNNATWSAEAWIYPTADATTMYLTGGTATVFGYNMYRRVTTLAIGGTIFSSASSCGGSGYAASGDVGSAPNNAWTYVAMTSHNSGSAVMDRYTFYGNAVQLAQVTSFSGTYCQVSSYDAINIGRRATNNFYITGRIDEVAIYQSNTSSAELGQARITAHYLCGITPGCAVGAGLPYIVKRPELPAFRDGNYFDYFVSRGYHTGDFSIREHRPQYLNVGFVPFTIVPLGNTAKR